MKQPLILFLYEKIFPGSQLLNRLQDIGYEVRAINAPADLCQEAARITPLLVITDLLPHQKEVLSAIAELKKNQTTSHLPVIAIVPSQAQELQDEARNAGATLVVNEQAILLHLKEFLEQALQVD